MISLLVGHPARNTYLLFIGMVDSVEEKARDEISGLQNRGNEWSGLGPEAMARFARRSFKFTLSRIYLAGCYIIFVQYNNQRRVSFSDPAVLRV